MTSGDPVLLERLVANLVDNAVRHNAPSGDLWLTTSTVDGQATLVVMNTGPVIARPALPILFEPFQRLQAGPPATASASAGDRRVDHRRPPRQRDRRAPTGRRPHGHGHHAPADQTRL